MNMVAPDTLGPDVYAKVMQATTLQSRGRPVVLLFDYCRVKDKYFFLERLSSTRKDFLFIVVDGSYADKHSVDSDNLVFLKAPKDIYFQKKQAKCDDSLLSIVSSDPTLNVAADIFYHLTKNFVNSITPEDAIANLYNTYQFTAKLIETMKPSYIFTWNQFHSHSRVVTKVAKIRKIPLGYLEHGLLPGSIQFDLSGQMGLSWIAREADQFDNLPITASSLSKTVECLATLRDSVSNRHPNVEEVELPPRDGRPRILLADHNDFVSGLYPVDSPERRRQSPHYLGTIEFLSANPDVLDRYQLIYRAHPLLKRELPVDIRSKISVQEGGDVRDVIDQVDAVATFVSQVSYLACMRDKPVVMLGINQLTRSKAAYRASKDLSAIQTFDIALQGGFEPKRDCWLDHATRLRLYAAYTYSEGDAFWVEGRDYGSRGSMAHSRWYREPGEIVDQLVYAAQSGASEPLAAQRFASIRGARL